MRCKVTEPKPLKVLIRLVEEQPKPKDNLRLPVRVIQLPPPEPQVVRITFGPSSKWHQAATRLKRHCSDSKRQKLVATNLEP